MPMNQPTPEESRGQLPVQKVREADLDVSPKAIMDYAQSNFYYVKRKVADIKALGEEKIRLIRELMDMQVVLDKKVRWLRG